MKVKGTEIWSWENPKLNLDLNYINYGVLTDTNIGNNYNGFYLKKNIHTYLPF